MRDVDYTMPETGPVSDSVAAKGDAPSVAQTGEADSAASPKTKAAEPSHEAQSASPAVEALGPAAGELGPADPPGDANAGADAESVGTGIEVDSAVRPPVMFLVFRYLTSLCPPSTMLTLLSVTMCECLNLLRLYQVMCTYAGLDRDTRRR